MRTDCVSTDWNSPCVDGTGSLVPSSKTSEFTAMSKRELIDRIMKLNRSARREFLQAFTENELADYLRQLESVQPVGIGYEARRSGR